jgi:hypothetical protein
MPINGNGAKEAESACRFLRLIVWGNIFSCMIKERHTDKKATKLPGLMPCMAKQLY